MIDLLSFLVGGIIGWAMNFLFTLFILGWMGGNLDRLERESRGIDEAAADQGR